MKTNTSGVLASYLDTCKERDKWTMKLHKLRNPGMKAVKSRGEFRKHLMSLFGPKEGSRAWALFIRSIRKEMHHAKTEHAYYKVKAQGLVKVLRYLRVSGYER